eukprot:scaffold1345_cov173-Ochromonas_danica.AAC.11
MARSVGSANAIDDSGLWRCETITSVTLYSIFRKRLTLRAVHLLENHRGFEISYYSTQHGADNVS